MRLAFAAVLALGLAACASNEKVHAPRPPQGPGPAGTEFGFWSRDAEAAVDAGFRSFISHRYQIGDVAKAQADLTKDGFECKDGNRPDGRPVPALECVRLYQSGDEISAWSVEFWPNDREPRAKYTRTYIRDPFLGDESKKKKPKR